MSVTREMVGAGQLLDPARRKTLSLALHQLCDLDELRDILSSKQAGQFKVLDISTNSFLEIDPAIAIFNNLEVLDLHLNLISVIEPFDGLSKLQELNLAHNQVAAIENLDGLPRLTSLNLSANKIEKIENIDSAGLKSLETLDLSHNRITEVEGLDNLPKLQTLNLRVNKLTRLSPIGRFVLPRLASLDVGGNEIRGSDLQDLIKAILPFADLKFIGLSGNPLVKTETNYIFRLLEHPGLEEVDERVVNRRYREWAGQLRKEFKVSELIDRTTEEYQKRLEYEREMQGAALARLKREEELQKQKLRSYEASMGAELDQVIGYVTRVNRRKEEGKFEDLDQATLSKWRSQLEELEAQRLQMENVKREEQKMQQDVLLDKELAHTSYQQRMYKISLERPEVWRAFKEKEFQRFSKQEEAYNERLKKQKTLGIGAIQDKVGELDPVVRPNQELVGEAMQEDFVEALERLREEAAQDDPDAQSVSLRNQVTSVGKVGGRRKTKGCLIF